MEKHTEEDEPCYYKFNVRLTIRSEDVPVEEITGRLGIFPHRMERKDDPEIFKDSPEVRIKPCHSWEISSDIYMIDEPHLGRSLAGIKSLLRGKEAILHDLMKDPRFLVELWIRIETDDVGTFMDIQTEDTIFLGLMNGVHITSSGKIEIPEE